MKAFLRKNTKLLCLAIVGLLIIAIIVLASRPTPQKVIGIWTNPETFHYENTYRERTLTLNKDGSFLEQTVISPTNMVISESGTWRIQGWDVICEVTDGDGDDKNQLDKFGKFIEYRMRWEYFFGKLKNGSWTLTLSGK